MKTLSLSESMPRTAKGNCLAMDFSPSTTSDCSRRAEERFRPTCADVGRHEAVDEGPR